MAAKAGLWLGQVLAENDVNRRQRFQRLQVRLLTEVLVGVGRVGADAGREVVGAHEHLALLQQIGYQLLGVQPVIPTQLAVAQPEKQVETVDVPDDPTHEPSLAPTPGGQAPTLDKPLGRPNIPRTPPGIASPARRPPQAGVSFFRDRIREPTGAAAGNQRWRNAVTSPPSTAGWPACTSQPSPPVPAPA